MFGERSVFYRCSKLAQTSPVIMPFLPVIFRPQRKHIAQRIKVRSNSSKAASTTAAGPPIEISFVVSPYDPSETRHRFRNGRYTS